MPRDLTIHEKLVEDVRSLRTIKRHWEYVVSPANDTAREELADRVAAAQSALDVHDDARRRAPAELELVNRRLEAAERDLKLEDSKDLSKLVDLLQKTAALQAEIAKDPAAMAALKQLGLLKA